MSSIFPRGQKLWCKVKDASGAWRNRPTPYRLGDEAKAKRFAVKTQQLEDARRGDDGVDTGPLTVAAYAKRWLKERRGRVASVRDDTARLERHVLPKIGNVVLDALGTKDVRDLVRDLTRGPLAPRTVRNIYRVLHVMLHDAEVDDLIERNPCRLKKGDLPKNVGADPEWRAAATYTTQEIERLISDPAVLPDRRVVYALKALGGLRHGEVASLRWRHYDAALEPLGRLLVATSFDSATGTEKGTKTDVTRRVPCHPTLAKVLGAWKLSGWQAMMERAPTAEDLIVPTRNFRPRHKKDARDALVRDLTALGLRVEAGAHRSRGGHDMRAWFITTLQEHGAHRDLLRVITHAAAGDVVSGYTARRGRRSAPRSPSCGSASSTGRSCSLVHGLVQSPN